MPIPGDGNCGLYATSTQVLLHRLDDENAFRVAFEQLFGTDQIPHLSHVAHLLVRYQQNMDDAVLYIDQVWRELHVTMRALMMKEMDVMATRGEWKGHLLNEDLRVVLKTHGEYLSPSCFYALASLLRQDISVVEFSANDFKWRDYCFTSPTAVLSDDDRLSRSVTLVFEPADTSHVDVENANHFNAFTRSRSLITCTPDWLLVQTHIRLECPCTSCY